MFYAYEVNDWAWPRVHVNVRTFTQFAQTASLLALKVSMHYNSLYDFRTIFSLLSVRKKNTCHGIGNHTHTHMLLMDIIW